MEETIKLGSNVQIEISGEKGIVIGIAHYLAGHTQYYVRYKAADGRAVESWWEVDAVILANESD